MRFSLSPLCWRADPRASTLLAIWVITACGDSGEKSKDAGADSGFLTIPDTGTGGNGGSGADPFPKCRRGSIGGLPGFDGPAPATTDDIDACFDACPETLSDDQFVACVESECPKFVAAFDCMNDEILSCSTAEDGDCRKDWEDDMCCADEKCSDLDPNSDSDQQTCLNDRCGTYTQRLSGCIDEVWASFGGTATRCAFEARANCVAIGTGSGDMDGGVDTDGGLDNNKSAEKARITAAPIPPAFYRLLKARKAVLPLTRLR